jgi:hypothetical protein
MNLQVISIFFQKWIDFWSVSLNSIDVAIKFIDKSLDLSCMISQLFSHLANFLLDNGADVADGVIDVRFDLE